MVLITKDGFQHLCALWRVGRSVGRVWAGGGEARQGERDQWLDLSWPLIWAALWDSWLFFCYPFPQRENFFSESTCWCCWKYKTISAHSSKLKTILPPKSSVPPPGGNQGWRETLTVTNYKCSRVSLWTDSSESARNLGNPGLIPGSGRSPGEGNHNPLQYSCLENPMDRGAWWATVHGDLRVGHDWVTNTDWLINVLVWSWIEILIFKSIYSSFSWVCRLAVCWQFVLPKMGIINPYVLVSYCCITITTNSIAYSTTHFSAVCMGQGSELVWLGSHRAKLQPGGSRCWGDEGLNWGRAPIQVPSGG